MMMSNELTVIAKLDDRQIQQKVEQWERRISHLNTQIQREERNWGRIIRGALSAASMTSSFLRRFLDMTVLALNPVYRAVMDAIMQTVYSLRAIASAYIVGGVTAGMAVAVEGAAIGLSIWGIANAMTGQQEMNSQMNSLRSMVYSFGTTLTSYGRLQGTWGESGL